jgi:hypothetical protein
LDRPVCGSENIPAWYEGFINPLAKFLWFVKDSGEEIIILKGVYNATET